MPYYPAPGVNNLVCVRGWWPPLFPQVEMCLGFGHMGVTRRPLMSFLGGNLFLTSGIRWPSSSSYTLKAVYTRCQVIVHPRKWVHICKFTGVILRYVFCHPSLWATLSGMVNIIWQNLNGINQPGDCPTSAIDHTKDSWSNIYCECPCGTQKALWRGALCYVHKKHQHCFALQGVHRSTDP